MSATKKPGDRRAWADVVREYSPFLTMGIQLAAAVVAFFLLGAWLDERWGTSPWLSLAGLLLGSVGGFMKFFTTVARFERKEHEREKK
ncbi:MAG: hypothetical protein HBSIN02_16880 [Bacteroidia bacterium]|nr:MAG: hypothetical protein HBSIN02_16880 [Bacteroidia bacterium]